MWRGEMQIQVEGRHFLNLSGALAWEHPDGGRCPNSLNTAPRQHIFAVSGKSNFLSVKASLTVIGTNELNYISFDGERLR
jgi:hypothetical protein